MLSGHCHNYERLVDRQGFPYFINGLGGAGVTTFLNTPAPGSRYRYLNLPGAQLIEANYTDITFKFFSAMNNASLVDCYHITRGNGTLTYAECAPIANQTSLLQSCGLIGSECSSASRCCSGHACRSSGLCELLNPQKPGVGPHHHQFGHGPPPA